MKTYISLWPTRAPELPFPRSLAILGSTGSIGVSALSVVAQHPGLFRVAALTGGKNAARLAEQAATFRPGVLAVLDEAVAAELKGLLPAGYAPEILVGPSAYEDVAAMADADLVLSAIVGAAGFLPTLAAAKAGKRIALANKEPMVMAGALLMKEADRWNARIIPVDSEPSAIFQCLSGVKPGGYDAVLRRVFLTASGGPFYARKGSLSSVTPAEALTMTPSPR